MSKTTTSAKKSAVAENVHRNLTIEQLQEVQAAMIHLGKEKLPSKVSYAIARNLLKTRPIVAPHEKIRTDELVKLARKAPDGEPLRAVYGPNDRFITEYKEETAMSAEVMKEKGYVVGFYLDSAGIEHMKAWDIEANNNPYKLEWHKFAMSELIADDDKNKEEEKIKVEPLILMPMIEYGIIVD